jgi:mevalonate kinase
MYSTFAKGKLMITGEYVVLDGALSLALPVKFGQYLKVEQGNTNGKLHWISRDYQGITWFTADFSLRDFSLLDASDRQLGNRLQSLLVACRNMNPLFCMGEEGYFVEVKANFPLNWGLGSSSTLIAALAHWSGVNAFQLSAQTFGGSGYDIACAYATGPICYQLDPKLPAGEREKVVAVPFDPLFKDKLYFNYLGNKQDSREGIRYYRSLDKKDARILVEKISEITREIVSVTSLSKFEGLLLEHEQLISSSLHLARAQDLYFPTLKGVVKSLGAWGGDFVLATCPIDEKSIPYSEMVE